METFKLDVTAEIQSNSICLEDYSFEVSNYPLNITYSMEMNMKSWGFDGLDANLKCRTIIMDVELLDPTGEVETYPMELELTERDVSFITDLLSLNDQIHPHILELTITKLTLKNSTLTGLAKATLVF